MHAKQNVKQVSSDKEQNCFATLLNKLLQPRNVELQNFGSMSSHISNSFSCMTVIKLYFNSLGQ